MSFSNILLQGDRNTGKTHLIGRIIERYGSRRLAGFFTWKDADGIVYFRAWDNAEPMEHCPAEVIYREDDRIIRHQIFEELGVRSIRHALEYAELMVFDELGRFEKECELFKEAVQRALVYETPVIAALKGEKNPFLDSLRKRRDVSLQTITKDNREELFKRIVLTLDPILFAR